MNENMNIETEFKPGQCAVYTEADGTTRSVTIRSVDENVVRIEWFAKRGFLTCIPLSHAAARKCLVLFPEGVKFMVLEGGAK